VAGRLTLVKIVLTSQPI
jgi:hypothetical protein